MFDEFISLLRNYLDGEVPLDSIRYWIGSHLGDPPSDFEPFMLDVALALWDMEYARKTGHATEDDFRMAVAELLAEQLEPTPSGDA